MKTTATLALLLAAAALDARAQHAGHVMGPVPPQETAKPAEQAKRAKPIKQTKQKTQKKRATTSGHGGHDMSTHHTQAAPTQDAASPHAGHDMSTMGDAQMPAGHDMSTQDTQAPTQDATSPHAGHDMSTMGDAQTPAGHDMSMHDTQVPTQDAASPHAGHDMSTHAAHEASAAPRTPIPALSEADRAAAFPPVAGHPAHDRGRFGFLRVDRLEHDDDGGTGWEAIGWYGGDIHRAWLRTEGRRAEGGVEDANLELFYGRLVAPWWDVLAGVRQDAGEGPARTWAAFGVQGLAPYKFEVRATGYLGPAGRTAARLEAEYDTLLTNRWILQWRGEADLYGRDDAERGLGRGLSTVEAGARLRYEITRRFAPYVGIEHERAYGRTATLRELEGEPARDTRVVAGLRLAF